MKHKLLLALSLSLVLAACTTPVKHNTPSGRPEATINGREAAVRKELTNVMVNSGFRLVRSDSSTIVFDRPITNAFAQFALASQYDHQPVARATYTIVDQGKSVRLIGDVASITNPGSAFERRTDFNSSPDSLQMQNVISGVKHSVEAR